MTKLKAEDRDDLETGEFAFPKQRKEPLENASHIRNAVARFSQVKDVSDDERNAAWKRIKAAAKSTTSTSRRKAGGGLARTNDERVRVKVARVMDALASSSPVG